MAKSPFDMSPGLIVAPPDSGATPDYPVTPPANPGQATGSQPSGVEKALGDMADQMHPVKTYAGYGKQRRKRTPL